MLWMTTCDCGGVSDCRKCRKRMNERARYRKNRDVVLQKQREYVANNQDRVRVWAENYRRKHRAALRERQRLVHSKSPIRALRSSLAMALRRVPTDNPITLDGLLALWHNQRGRCSLSGLSMTWGQGTITPTSISMDRLDISAGYTTSNVRLICYQANCLRNKWGDQEAVSMARSISEHFDCMDGVASMLSLAA